MKKKRKDKLNFTFNILFSNRVMYTLIVFLIFAIISVGVYATNHPNPGHLASEINEIDPTVLNFAQNGIDDCSAGGTIKTINDDGTVVCEASVTVPIHHDHTGNVVGGGSYLRYSDGHYQCFGSWMWGTAVCTDGDHGGTNYAGCSSGTKRITGASGTSRYFFCIS